MGLVGVRTSRFAPTSSLLELYTNTDKKLKCNGSSKGPGRCATYWVCDLPCVHLLVVYLNSTQVQTSSRNALAVSMDLLGV